MRFTLREVKPFEIFRSGRHTATSGATLDFPAEMLKAAVEAYDPALHPAPIVVGHPRDNHPAFGWVDKLSLDDAGNVVAAPSDVNADFADLVQKRVYRTRSASWYLPDSPGNPKPGSLYLRHVGFLGAQPPAIKGLKDVQFAEDEAGVVEFADADTGMLARMLRGLRDFLIEQFGVEKADKALPDWAVGDLEHQARTPASADAAAAMPAFAEGTDTEENAVDEQKLKELETEAARLKSELAEAQAKAAESASFAESRAADLARREAELARKEIETKVDGLIAAGKVLPAQRAHVVSFAASLSDEGECIDFAEAGKGKDVLTQRASYLRMLDEGPKLVDFKERAKDERPNRGTNGVEFNEREIGRRAHDYAEEQRKKGIVVSATDAVLHVTEQLGLAG